MELTSQTVHQIGGVVFILLALVSTYRVLRHGELRLPEWLLAGLFIGYGIESYVDPLVHGASAPENYTAESAQHLVQGTALIIAGVLEMFRLAGVLKGRIWIAVVPVSLFVFGGIFLFHAQSGMDPEAMVMMTLQHRAFGLSLWVAAAARAFSDFLLPNDRAAAMGWISALLIFGLLLLSYQEGSNPAM